jgi:hypothetical protein
LIGTLSKFHEGRLLSSALSAMEGSRIEEYRRIEVRKLPIIVNLRQVNASSRGKELVQVTLHHPIKLHAFQSQVLRHRVSVARSYLQTGVAQPSRDVHLAR